MDGDAEGVVAAAAAVTGAGNAGALTGPAAGLDGRAFEVTGPDWPGGEDGTGAVGAAPGAGAFAAGTCGALPATEAAGCGPVRDSMVGAGSVAAGAGATGVPWGSLVTAREPRS